MKGKNTKNTLNFIDFSFEERGPKEWDEEEEAAANKNYSLREENERELMGRGKEERRNAKTRSSSCAPENLFHTIRGLLFSSFFLDNSRAFLICIQRIIRWKQGSFQGNSSYRMMLHIKLNLYPANLLQFQVFLFLKICIFRLIEDDALSR